MSLKDQAGQSYSSPDGKAAGDGVSVTVNTSTGPRTGKMVGGTVVPSESAK